MNSTAGGDTSMLLPVLCQQQGEQTRKAKEAFDSLFDDHYVFGIPHKTGNRSDWCSNETSALLLLLLLLLLLTMGGSICRMIFSHRAARRTILLLVVMVLVMKALPIILLPTRKKVATCM